MSILVIFFLIGIALFAWTAYQISLGKAYIPRHSHKPFAIGRRKSHIKGMVWVSRSRAPFRFWSTISNQSVAALIILGFVIYKVTMQ